MSFATAVVAHYLPAAVFSHMTTHAASEALEIACDVSTKLPTQAAAPACALELSYLLIVVCDLVALIWLLSLVATVRVPRCVTARLAADRCSSHVEGRAALWVVHLLVRPLS